MADFTLDTSGAVATTVPGVLLKWSDLDAFTQGTLTRASEELDKALRADPGNYLDGGGAVEYIGPEITFRAWSPEALAMILADCAEFQAHPISNARHPLNADAGRAFWESCQRGERPDIFPPRLISLGDDGRVHLEVAK